MGTGPTFDSYVPSTVYVKQDEAAEKILQSAKDLLVDYPVETEIIIGIPAPLTRMLSPGCVPAGTLRSIFSLKRLNSISVPNAA